MSLIRCPHQAARIVAVSTLCVLLARASGQSDQRAVDAIVALRSNDIERQRAAFGQIAADSAFVGRTDDERRALRAALQWGLLNGEYLPAAKLGDRLLRYNKLPSPERWNVQFESAQALGLGRKTESALQQFEALSQSGPLTATQRSELNEWLTHLRAERAGTQGQIQEQDVQAAIQLVARAANVTKHQTWSHRAQQLRRALSRQPVALRSRNVRQLQTRLGRAATLDIAEDVLIDLESALHDGVAESIPESVLATWDSKLPLRASRNRLWQLQAYHRIAGSETDAAKALYERAARAERKHDADDTPAAAMRALVILLESPSEQAARQRWRDRLQREFPNLPESKFLPGQIPPATATASAGASPDRAAVPDRMVIGAVLTIGGVFLLAWTRVRFKPTR